MNGGGSSQAMIRRSALAVDTALALLFAAFVVAVSEVRAGHGAGPFDAWALRLLAGAALTLSVRRLLPLVAYAGTLAFTATYLLAGYAPGPVFLVPFASLLTVVAVCPTRLWAAAAVVGAAVLALAHGVGSGWSLGTGIFALAWLVLAGGFGAGLQVRRRFLAEVQAQAHWAERSREEQARRRMAEERLRIAREMHDVVGHSLAVISLQAGVAEHLLDSRPEDVRRAIAAIRQVSRSALADLRMELALLRGEGREAAARVPTPGLSALPELVASVRQAGLDVRLDMQVPEGSVPEIVSAAAYRIVQESLTNVARHAGAGVRAKVRLRAVDGTLDVEVADDGPGAATATPEGSGLTGMRERAAALGGTFQAGNAPGGGFCVRASLPWKLP
jgi:signal transduction histidine kinase